MFIFLLLICFIINRVRNDIQSINIQASKNLVQIDNFEAIIEELKGIIKTIFFIILDLHTALSLFIFNKKNNIINAYYNLQCS